MPSANKNEIGILTFYPQEIFYGQRSLSGDESHPNKKKNHRHLLAKIINRQKPRSNQKTSPFKNNKSFSFLTDPASTSQRENELKKWHLFCRHLYQQNNFLNFITIKEQHPANHISFNTNWSFTEEPHRHPKPGLIDQKAVFEQQIIYQLDPEWGRTYLNQLQKQDRTIILWPAHCYDLKTPNFQESCLTSILYQGFDRQHRQVQEIITGQNSRKIDFTFLESEAFSWSSLRATLERCQTIYLGGCARNFEIYFFLQKIEKIAPELLSKICLIEDCLIDQVFSFIPATQVTDYFQSLQENFHLQLSCTHQRSDFI